MSNSLTKNAVPSSALPDKTFPSEPVQTVVGPAQLQQKSYDIQGQLVNSTKDKPIDVNALQGAYMPPGGYENLSGPLYQPWDGPDAPASDKGGKDKNHQNPNQTFLSTKK